MKTFEQYVNEAEEQLNRRGFLRGLAAFAASAAVPAPVVKMLATPAGVAAMPIPAGIALLKGIQDHLNQWDAEDDDDLFDAQEDMAGALGFEGIEPDYDDEDRGDDISATDQMFDLLDLYRTNPELAAAQLIKHLQSVAIDSKDIETSFKSRADNPADWRYQNKLKEPDDEEIPDTSLSNISRLAGLAKGIASGDNQEPAPAVKDMGPVQYAKDTPALPAPTKPEVDLTPDLKSKEKVPVQRKGDDAMSEKLGDNRPKLGTKRDQGKSVRKWRTQHNLDESTELSGILKNAGLKS